MTRFRCQFKPDRNWIDLSSGCHSGFIRATSSVSFGLGVGDGACSTSLSGRFELRCNSNVRKRQTFVHRLTPPDRAILSRYPRQCRGPGETCSEAIDSLAFSPRLENLIRSVAGAIQMKKLDGSAHSRASGGASLLPDFLGDTLCNSATRLLGDWSGITKDVLSSPPLDSRLGHAEWDGDGWGGSAVGDWMGYIVTPKTIFENKYGLVA